MKHRSSNYWKAAAAIAVAAILTPVLHALPEETFDFSIEAQPLSQAMTELSDTTGVQVLLPGAEAGEQIVSGVSGEMTVQQALSRLLSDTGLNYQATGESTVAVVAETEGGFEITATDGDAEVLPETVFQSQNQLIGEAEGFRAETSSSALNVDAPLMETPTTVNVLTEDFIDKIGIRSVEELMQYVPGAGVENAGDPFSPKFNLRGFTVDSLESGGLYVDGYQAVRRGYHFDRSLYERADVLKGTSAVTFGLASPGGIVNYIAKKPKFEEHYKIEGTVGSFDTWRSGLDFTGSLNDSETLAYRLLATVHESNQTVNGENSDLSFDDRIVISPSLVWKTPTGGSLYANYEYSEIESVFDPGIKRLDSGRFLFDTDPFVGPASGFERDIHKGKIEFVQPIVDNWEFLIGGVVTRSNNVSSIDASFFGNLDGNPMPRWTAKSIEDYEQTEFRAEINGEFNTGANIRHNLTFGVNYLETELSVNRANVTTNNAIDPFNPQFGQAPALGNPVPWFANGSDPEISAFLQDYLTIDNLKVFGGLRYTEFDIFRVHTVAEDFRNSDEVIDWNLGVIYNQNNWLNPFVSYATSTEPQDAVSAPREGEQIEVGLKSLWFDDKLATTLSLFQVEQSDIAEEFPANSGNFRLVGDQRTRGVEFEATGKITNQISLIGGYSYLDAEFTESTTGNKGNTPHSVPEHKVSVFAEYAFNGDFEGWRAGLGFINVGDRKGDNANTFELPSYERVDLTLEYAKGPFNFQASIENVFDEEYIAGSGGNGHRLAQGAPRFFTLSAGYKF